MKIFRYEMTGQLLYYPRMKRDVIANISKVLSIFLLGAILSPQISASAAGLPSAITINKVDVAGSSVSLGWSQKNAPSNKIYKVEIKNVSNTKIAPVILTTSNTSLLFEKLALNSKYEVRVQLTFGKYFYPWSPKSTFSTVKNVAPVAPTGLALGVVTDVSANITWQSLAGVTSYNIYLDGKLVGTTSASNFQISKLSGKSTYKVAVTSLIGAKESVLSPSISIETKAPTQSVSTGPTINDTITAVLVSELNTTSARVTWVSASNSKGFTLKVLDAAGTTVVNTYEISGQLRTFVVTGLSPASTYQVSLIRNNMDESTSSTPLTTFVTTRNPSMSLLAVAASTTSVNLSWNPVAGAAQYDIFRDGSLVAPNVTAATTSYTATGLTPGYTYSFVVRVASYDANKNLVYSEMSSGVTGTPNPDPSFSPVNLALPYMQLPYATVPVVGAVLTAQTGTWKDPAQITFFGYQWQRSIDNGTSWFDLPGQVSSQYAVVASDYQYKLRVVVTARNNNGGTSANSVSSGVVDALYNVQVPIVRGALIPGQLLQATEGVWSSRYPMTYTYQWYRGNSEIAGEQTPAYTLVNGDIGYRISVQVTAITPLGSLTVPSAVRSMVTAIANTELPVVTGVAKTFSTLTTTVGTWIGNPVGTTYQWQRSTDMSTWDAIPGATASTYTTVLGDAGFYIRSEVYETKTVSSITYKVAAASLPTPLITVLTVTINNTVLPAISGTWNVGQVLSLSNGGWSTNGTFTYQWQSSSNGSSWVDIAGATAASYTLTNAEAGLYIRAKVQNASGTATGFAYSNVTAKVGAPFNTAAPTLTGVLQVGETQTVATGTWLGAPTYSYQWQSSTDGIAWSAIAGATSETWIPTYALSNSRIRSVVTAANAVDTVTAVSATLTGFAPPRVSVIPAITGTSTSGQVLTTSTGTWPNTSSGYEYQWQRSSDNGASWVNINSAISTTYTLVAGDVGYQVRSQVSVRNNTGTSTAYSLPTAIVAP
ncbi:Fibronectin type III [Candidatus Nanopelagicaceae bacterium]